MQDNVELGYPQSSNSGDTSEKRFDVEKLTVFVILLLVVVIAALSVDSIKLRKSIQDLNDEIKQTQSIPEINTQENVPPDSLQAIERIGECNEESCLYLGADAVEGLGKVTGYYHTYQKTEMSGELVTCDALIVEDGTDELVDNLLKWVREGNGVNSITHDGKLILNIVLPSEYESKIQSSSLSSPVTLTIVRHTPQSRGAGSCSSFVSIIKAE